MQLSRFTSPFVCSTLLMFGSLAAHAQVSVYGSAALANYVFYNQNRSAAKRDTGAVIGGVFYNFPIQSRLTAGIDARGSYGFGARGGALATAAVRIGFVPERVALRPYFLIGGGVVTSTATSNLIVDPVTQSLTQRSTRFTNGALELAGGLDVRLTQSFDLRAVELGAAAGASNSGISVGSAFLDAGIVYHLHPRP